MFAEYKENYLKRIIIISVLINIPFILIFSQYTLNDTLYAEYEVNTWIVSRV